MSKAIQSPITPAARPSVTSVTGRRAALGLFGAALLAAAPVRAAANPGAFAPLPVAPSPDAELIRLCDAFNALEAKIQAAYSDGPEGIEDDNARDDFLEPIRAAQDDLLCQIEAIRATTMQGVMARAAMFAGWADDILADWAESHSYDERMLLALVRDAAALSGPPGAAWPASAEPGVCAPGPVAARRDAELIRLCDAYNALETRIVAVWRRWPPLIEDDSERAAFLEPLHEERDACLRHIKKVIRATDGQGALARAAMFAACADDALTDWTGSGACNSRMLLTLVRDVPAPSRAHVAAWPALAEREGA